MYIGVKKNTIFIFKYMVMTEMHTKTSKKMEFNHTNHNLKKNSDIGR